MAADQLARLEEMGLMTAKDIYQALLIMIADDIRQQHRHRQARRKELGKLKNTKAALEQKSAFLRERMRDYQKYLQTVQESTASGVIKVTRGGRPFWGKKKNHRDVLWDCFVSKLHSSPAFSSHLCGSTLARAFLAQKGHRQRGQERRRFVL